MNDNVSDKTNFKSNESILQRKRSESGFQVPAQSSRIFESFSLIL